MASPTTGSSELVPFVPRLTIEWLAEHPDRTWLELDGTLAFVDISGFTAMSEQLSALGKAGAEEVTDVMNATFAALLDVAYSLGGGLLKFGGDALLLLYDGDDHAPRAARAAYEMRRTLRAIGRPRTSAGAVQLRMHAGLHSGRFQFFLVGQSHRELLITGPAATRTVAMEATSEAGEIVVSPETAAQLDPALLGEAKGEGFLLQAAPEVKGSLRELPDVSEVPIEQAVPAPLRRQLLEVGQFEGEHRHGAIAFVRYSGTDEIIATEGAEAAADAIAVLAERLQEAAAEHQVTFLESDVDKDGGRIILVAGAPQTFGDDEERLLRTVRAAVDSGLPLPIHVGVSQGRMFAGQVGAPFRRTYTILGDTAALAARLMARSGEDEIWVAAEAYARGGSRFAATELEPFLVKGKSEPADEALGDEIPFVDRERERAVLSASLAPVRMGFGTLVELVGEPGIGKSRLADELRSQCADMQRLTIRCEQYESSTAYYPFRPFLRSLLEVEPNGSGSVNLSRLVERLQAIDEGLVPWAPLLGAPLDIEVESTPEVDDLDPSFRRARLHGVVSSLLGRLLDHPTLLVFEDVHWMDDASSELLRHLGTQLSTRPWLTCTTRRASDGGFLAAEGTPPLPALTLRLEPLPADDARTLIRAAARDRNLSEDELRAIFDRGAGNPLFLQELAAREDTGGDEQLPDTVEALVAARIDELAPADRALLRWASVLGTSFSGSLVAAVLEGDPTAALDSEAWDRLAEFVERDPDVPGAFRFRHALIRDGAYDGLSFRRRRELHARVAEVIEQRAGSQTAESSELLSLHFHLAELWPETWRYSGEAGRRAEVKYANVEAVAFFERALDAAARWGEAPVEEVAAIWEALADARMRLGEYERAGEAYREARAVLPPEPVAQTALMQKEAIASLRLGQYDDALTTLERAMQLVGGAESSAAAMQHARLVAWYGTVLQYERRPQEAVEWCERAIEEAKQSDARDALAQAYFILDWAHVALGQIDQAVHSERAAAIYEELDQLERLGTVLNNMAGIAYLSGRWDDSVDLLVRSRTAFLKVGDEWRGAFAAENIAEVRSDQGRGDEADSLLRGALEVRRAGGVALDTAKTLSLLGREAARQGNFEEADALLDEARELWPADGSEVEMLAIEVRRAERLVLEGQAAAALASADEALRRATGIEGASMIAASLHRLRGWALLQGGDAAAAQDAFDQGLELARLDDANYAIMNPDYEIALALDGLVQARGRGADTAGLAAERDAILARLGVVKRPEPPLP